MTPPLTELDALFIGPGQVSDKAVKAVVLNVPSLTSANCSVPDLPYEIFYGYVGKNTDKGPMLCGSSDESGYECLVLVRNGTWVKGKGTISERKNAAAVETSAGWWVTGSPGESNILRKLANLFSGGWNKQKDCQSSTEVWDGKTWKKHIELPTPLCNHCMVKINSTHYFLTGGATSTLPEFKTCLRREIIKKTTKA